MKRLRVATPITIAALTTTLAVSASAATITELPAAGRPGAIAAGPDGTMWFTDSASPALGEISPAGTVSELSGLSAPANAVAVGANGTVAAAEGSRHKIVTLTGGGAPTESATHDNGAPAGVAVAADGSVWYTETGPSQIVHGNSFWRLGGGSLPAAITLTPDGRTAYVTDARSGQILKVSSSSVSLVTAGLTGPATSITVGPDGNLWVTEPSPGRIGEINPSTGAITEYAAGLTANSDPSSITAGPDGDLWFTESANPGRIGRINPSTGAITEYAAGLTANGAPSGIAAGAGGRLWFTEAGAPGRVGEVSLAPIVSGASASGSPGGVVLTGAVNANDEPTSYHFDWGTTTAYGHSAPSSPALAGSDLTIRSVSQTLPGLIPGAVYHFRLVAANLGGTAYGPDVSFVAPTAASNGPLPTLTGPAPTPGGSLPPASPPAGAGPVVGKTARISLLTGRVLVTLPGTRSAVPLARGQVIPLGAVVDARHGVVGITNALRRAGRTQSATLWGGRFSMRQAHSGRTTFTLPRAALCRAPRDLTHARRAVVVGHAATAGRPGPVHLWAHDHHGLYTTRGNNSVATVRGTVWETIETCAGTRTIVRSGVVSVLNLHTHRSVLVHAGHSVLVRR